MEGGEGRGNKRHERLPVLLSLLKGFARDKRRDDLRDSDVTLAVCETPD
jgi:hypothetical protein